MTPIEGGPFDDIVRALQERAKELNCLYTVEEILATRHRPPARDVPGDHRRPSRRAGSIRPSAGRSSSATASRSPPRGSSRRRGSRCADPGPGRGGRSVERLLQRGGAGGRRGAVPEGGAEAHRHDRRAARAAAPPSRAARAASGIGWQPRAAGGGAGGDWCVIIDLLPQHRPGPASLVWSQDDQPPLLGRRRRGAGPSAASSRWRGHAPGSPSENRPVAAGPALDREAWPTRSSASPPSTSARARSSPASRSGSARTARVPDRDARGRTTRPRRDRRRSGAIHHAYRRAGPVAAIQVGLRVSLIRRLLTDRLEFIDAGQELHRGRRLLRPLRASSVPPRATASSGARPAACSWRADRADAARTAASLVKIPRTWYVTSDAGPELHRVQPPGGPLQPEVPGDRAGAAASTRTSSRSSRTPISRRRSSRASSLALDDFEGRPLIVRSSSLLEDRVGSAFSGKYKSLFLANQGTKKPSV